VRGETAWMAPWTGEPGEKSQGLLVETRKVTTWPSCESPIGGDSCSL
jgi:hypothetical protein